MLLDTWHKSRFTVILQHRTSKIWNHSFLERDNDLEIQCNSCSVKIVRASNVKAFGMSSLLKEMDVICCNCDFIYYSYN